MPTATQLNATDYGFTPTAANPSSALRTAIIAAIAEGRPLHIEPGTYSVGDVLIDGAVELHGVPGKVVLKFAPDKRAILRIANFGAVHISGIAFDGNGLSPVDYWTPGFRGLVVAQRTAIPSRLRLQKCRFNNCPNGYGLVVASASALVDDNEFAGVYGATAAVNHDGFTFSGNRLTGLLNNGVVVDRSSGTPSATTIVSNTITGVAVTIPESTGYQGNGVLVAGESNVVVARNDVSNCAFSAVRLNGCTRLRVSENHCHELGEVAIYIEGFSDGRQVANDGFDAVVTGNIINDAGVGVAVANINYSGRLAVISNNVIRRISPRDVAVGTTNQYTSPGLGIGAETCVVVTSNFIEGAARGIDVAAGSYTEDSVIAGNVVRSTTLAMGVSTVSGAKDVLISNNIAAGFATVASGGGALRPLNAAGDVVSGSLDLASFTESTSNANLRIEGVVKRQAL